MKIVFISDTHGRQRAPFAKLIPNDTDMLIHCGDISGAGGLMELRLFYEWFESFNLIQHKIFIAGNHDLLFERNEEAALSIKPDDITYLNDSGVNIEGIDIWGSPVSPEFNNWAFNRIRGGDIRSHWNKIPRDTDILITHGPPFDILDLVPAVNYGAPADDKAGCVDLRDAVREIKPSIHAFGHIHEGYGTYKNENTLFINASTVTWKYQPLNSPIIVEYDEYEKKVLKYGTHHDFR